VARFLIDESLPRAVTRELVAAGHDAVDARDVGLQQREAERDAAELEAATFFDLVKEDRRVDVTRAGKP
jgi:hypothetical protein